MRRAAAALAALALLAGCGSERSAITAGGRVVGDNVTVYSMLPEPRHGVGRDLVDAEKLALLQAGGRAAGLGVNFVSVDEGAPGRDSPPRAAGKAAEQAARDAQTIAVIGGLRSHAARTSVPLLNAAGLLYVSPGAGYAGFTEPLGRNEPQRWYPAGYRSFDRVIGDDLAQASELLLAARRASGGRPRVAVEVEAGPDGDELAQALRLADRDNELTRLVDDPQRADAVIYAGTDVRSAAGVAEALARERPRAALVFPDELTRAGLAEQLPPRARRLAVMVSSAPEPGSTPELQAFERAFADQYGRRPDPYAVLGWLAMRQVLAALDRAGPRANLRRVVIDRYFELPALPKRFSAFRPQPGGGRDYLRDL